MAERNVAEVAKLLNNWQPGLRIDELDDDGFEFVISSSTPIILQKLLIPAIVHATRLRPKKLGDEKFNAEMSDFVQRIIDTMSDTEVAEAIAVFTAANALVNGIHQHLSHVAITRATADA